MKYSCLIPIYNEESRISDVLKTVIKVKEVSEIICIDDGSSDKSPEVVKKNFPQVALVVHKRNLGKTAAILTGINRAKGDNLLLLDSDLKNLKSTEIDRAITLFEKNDLDCLLFNTAPMSRIDQIQRHIFRFLLLAAGNRIIRKQCLEDALASGNFESYHLEIAQNKYLMEHNKNVAYFDISAVDISKISKEGFLKGVLKELIMWRQIVGYAGFLFFLKQTLFFAREKIN